MATDQQSMGGMIAWAASRAAPVALAVASDGRGGGGGGSGLSYFGMFCAGLFAAFALVGLAYIFIRLRHAGAAPPPPQDLQGIEIELAHPPAVAPNNVQAPVPAPAPLPQQAFGYPAFAADAPPAPFWV